MYKADLYAILETLTKEHHALWEKVLQTGRWLDRSLITKKEAREIEKAQKAAWAKLQKAKGIVFCNKHSISEMYNMIQEVIAG